MNNFNNDIDRLTSRHIAKLLSRLGNMVEPLIKTEIKKEFRYLADDIKHELNIWVRKYDNENRWNK